MKTVYLLTVLIGSHVASGVILKDGRRSNHGGGLRFSSSSSSSSEEYGGGKHHHGNGHGHGNHGNNPRPPRPPRPSPTAAPQPQCETGWTTFDRLQGRWCVRTFLSGGTYYNGQSFCANYGAVLTGIQNSTERMALADMALAQVLGTGASVASTWIGSMRGQGSQFHWTDSFTTGTDGFKWGLTQPDGQTRAGLGIQSCVQQFIITPAYWRSPGWGNTFQHGDLDDWYCNFANESPFTRLFACGKKPTA